MLILGGFLSTLMPTIGPAVAQLTATSQTARVPVVALAGNGNGSRAAIHSSAGNGLRPGGAVRDLLHARTAEFVIRRVQSDGDIHVVPAGRIWRRGNRGGRHWRYGIGYSRSHRRDNNGNDVKTI